MVAKGGIKEIMRKSADRVRAVMRDDERDLLLDRNKYTGAMLRELRRIRGVGNSRRCYRAREFGHYRVLQRIRDEAASRKEAVAQVRYRIREDRKNAKAYMESFARSIAA